MSRLRLPWLAVPLALGLQSASAQQPTAPGAGAKLSGEWLATPLQTDWVIDEWSPACGPRPSGGGAPGGTVTVHQKGAELSMSGAGRAYSTTECWEQAPGLSRVSHSVGPQSYRNVCQTLPQDPRQTTLVTTITATADQITFDETGEYQFVVEGQSCAARARRTRFMRLVRRDGEAFPAPSASAPPYPSPAAPSDEPGACASPAEPARLEVRPSRKLLRPGETFTFGASVLDRAGCSLSVAPTFKLVGMATGVELTGPGTLRVSDEAGEGEVKLLATLDDHSITVVAEIVSRERYDAMLRQGRFDGDGASVDVAVTRIESGSIGARSPVLHDEGEARRRVFVAIVGSAALLLGLVGLVALRRARTASRERDRDSWADDPPSAASADRSALVRTARLEPPRRVTPAKGMVCPTCREEFPPDASFCANDANRLVPLKPGLSMAPAGGVCPTCGLGFDPGVAACPEHDEPLIPAAVYATKLESTRLGVRKICPACAARFSGESRFCGKCGAGLVPVN